MAGVSGITITDSGTQYTVIPTVTISLPDADSADCSVTPNLSDGVITSIDIADSGTYYVTTPDVTIPLPDTDSADAEATLEVTSDGSITDIIVTSQGAYYLGSEEATISYTNQDNDAVSVTTEMVITNGKVISINIPVISAVGEVTIAIDPPTGSAPDFQATATATLTNGSVSAITVTEGGGMYATTPSIIVDSADGSAASYRATATAVLDTNTNKIQRIDITDSGEFYETAPSITITAPTDAENFIVGETVTQTLSDGTVMSGEVVKYTDSDTKLYLIHVGANDGKFHTFETDSAVTGAVSEATGIITAINEVNQLSENEQNEYFDDLTDFLDFTESNPFGDPS